MYPWPRPKAIVDAELFYIENVVLTPFISSPWLVLYIRGPFSI
jgi:hypothetical protein